MSQVRLTPTNLDLIRRIDADQDGEITPAEAGAATDQGLLDGPEITALDQTDRTTIRQVGEHQAGRVQVTFRGQSGRGTWAGAVPQLATQAAEQHGLPPILMRTPAAVVRHGDDPGDYFCEHVFFTAQETAGAAGSQVLTNAHGERLVGFLHLPADAATRQAPRALDQTDRHRETRQVVGTALRGYVDAAAPQTQGPVRILLTGFGPFQSIRNNPSGDFVAHQANVDAAMAVAFGDRLQTPRGTVEPGRSAEQMTLRYRISDEAGQVREVLVQARRLPVSDRAMSGKGSQSIKGAMQAFRPHGVLAMGVNPSAPRGHYQVESHADDGGLRAGRHDDDSSPTRSLPANYALARAIAQGETPAITH